MLSTCLFIAFLAHFHVCMASLLIFQVLPCLHTFCLGCLGAYLPPESLTITCPLCGQQSILPQKGVRRHLANFTNEFSSKKKASALPIFLKRKIKSAPNAHFHRGINNSIWSGKILLLCYMYGGIISFSIFLCVSTLHPPICALLISTQHSNGSRYQTLFSQSCSRTRYLYAIKTLLSYSIFHEKWKLEKEIRAESITLEYQECTAIIFVPLAWL